MKYTTYILECSDKTLYTGSTNNLEKRLIDHNTKKTGAKYTRGRRPVVLKYIEKFDTFKEARQREAQIKKLTKTEKLILIRNQT